MTEQLKKAPSWAIYTKRRMAVLGLLQKDLCIPLGVTTRGAVGHYLSGRRELSFSQAVSLADTLGVEVSDLERPPVAA